MGKACIFGLVVLIVAGVFLMRKDHMDDTEAPDENQLVVESSVDQPVSVVGSRESRPEPAIVSAGAPIRPVFDEPMEKYGSGSGFADLQQVKEAMEIYKARSPGKTKRFPPVTTNRILVKALTGQTAAGVQVILREHPYINPEGELTDQWGTALKFHAVSQESVGIESAGPDQQWHTDDDLNLPAEEKILMVDEPQI